HEFLLRHWPSLTPEQALNDLFGSRALLGSAARGTELKVDDLELVHRPRAPHALVGDIHWSNADIPLLDELLALLGISLEGRDDDERIKERDERDEFEQAAEVDRRAEEAGEAFDDEDDLPGFEVADDDLGIGGMFDTSILDERFEVPE
ncbi:MAG: hypothetical protein AAF531_17180, partial [Actinomycetota bacterium]